MRIAVAGGTGLVGRPLVAALEGAGHEAVALSRSNGIDLLSGEGLVDALFGVDSVIDVTNTPKFTPEETVAFFGAVTEHLLQAEREAGVGHHVELSIVGLDRVQGNAHYAGKRRQEELVQAGPVPWTIVRATQFHDFAGMVVSWTRRDDSALVPPLLVQPVAIDDVVELLVEVASGPHGQGRLEIAGPKTEDLVDMARRSLAARGESVELIPTWRGSFSDDMAGEVLLPGDEARIASTTFDQWLASQGADGS
jgi:uncharacterized protein YbjT (DUF2867 family)